MFFHLIKWLTWKLPTPAASRLACWLAGFTSRPRFKTRDRQALAQARRMIFGRRKVAWCWGEDGAVIILVHGWGGHAAQMAPLARALAARGFRCVAPDITGHGQSPGRRTGFHRFMQDIAQLAGHLQSSHSNQEIYACVGHSAGGLALMAARDLHHLHASRFVSISAPRYPYVPVAKIRQFINPPTPVLEACKPYFARQFTADWDTLRHGHAFRYTGHGALLLIYDHDDDQVNHHDGDAIQQHWPGAQLIKTHGLGHNKVLWDDTVINAVMDFLNPASQKQSDPRQAVPSKATPNHITQAKVNQTKANQAR